MNNMDSSEELFCEGLKSYLEVKSATRLYETLIGEISKEVMLRYFEQLKSIISQPTITETDIKIDITNFDPKPSRVAVGAVIYAPETWGIRWGLKWNLTRMKDSISPSACISIRVSAAAKRTNLFRALNSLTLGQSPKIEEIPEWPHEIHISKALQFDVTASQFKESLDMVILAFIEMAAKTGDLKTAIAGKLQV